MVCEFRFCLWASYTNQALAIIRLDQSKAYPKFINYFFRHPNVIDYVNNLSGQSAQPNINFEEIKSIEVGLPILPEQKTIIILVLKSVKSWNFAIVIHVLLHRSKDLKY